MSARKRTRWITLARHAVDWSCLRADRTPGSTIGVPWQRMVLLHGVEDDGREVCLPLSPAEARDLAARLVARADNVDLMNAQHGNGFPLPLPVEVGAGR